MNENYHELYLCRYNSDCYYYDLQTAPLSNCRSPLTRDHIHKRPSYKIYIYLPYYFCGRQQPVFKQFLY